MKCHLNNYQLEFYLNNQGLNQMILEEERHQRAANKYMRSQEIL